MTRGVRGLTRALGAVTCLLTLACGATQSATQPSDAEQVVSSGARAQNPLIGTTCNSRQLWSTTAYPLSKVAGRQFLKEAVRHGVTLPVDVTAKKALLKSTRSAVFWWMIRVLTVEGGRHNSAALPLRGFTTRDGKPLWLVRSGYTAQPSRKGSCYAGLVGGGGVRHVLNLYDGDMFTDDLDAAEQSVVTAAGGTYAHPTNQGWRGATRTTWKAWHNAKNPTATRALQAAYVAARTAAAKIVAATIQQHLLQPAGTRPSGHLLVHCGGGMHRTGMVVGVLDRCINGTAMARIEADYKRHVGWQSAAHPGGFEAQNLDFIQHFPCEMIRPKGQQR